MISDLEAFHRRSEKQAVLEVLDSGMLVQGPRTATARGKVGRGLRRPVRGGHVVGHHRPAHRAAGARHRPRRRGHHHAHSRLSPRSTASSMRAPARVRRHRGRDLQPQPGPDRGGHHAAHQGAHAGAPVRLSLRHGCHPRHRPPPRPGRASRMPRRPSVPTTRGSRWAGLAPAVSACMPPRT